MPDCKACKENRRANAEFSMVGVMAAANRRTFIALIVSIILLFLSNAIWLYAWMQYDYVVETESTQTDITVDAKDGTANYIGNDGDIINGEDNRQKEDDQNNPNP